MHKLIAALALAGVGNEHRQLHRRGGVDRLCRRAVRRNALRSRSDRGAAEFPAQRK
jgi:hypothetical protein